MKSKIVSDKSKIKIKNLNPQKRPIMAVADNVEIKNSKDIIFQLIKKLFLKFYIQKRIHLIKKLKLNN